MICTSCGRMNTDGVLFCEYCGTELRLRTLASGDPMPASVTGYPAPPSAAQVAQMGRSILGSLTMGEKFVGAGVVAAVLGFFLPWFSTPNLGALSGIFSQLGVTLNQVSFSGVDVAKFIGAVYLILLVPIAAGVLFYYSRTASTSQKLLMSGFQVMIGSLYGPVIIADMLFVPMIQSMAGVGLWLLGLGYCAIAAGGLITIGTVGKAIR